MSIATSELTGPRVETRGLVPLAYAVSAFAVWLGWVVTRNYTLVDPEQGLGYWLGIVGASLMGILLLYPVRKRIRIMRILGPTRHWFRMHMVFGVLGPILILYHCNFQLGSTNSNIALVCTLLVATSGLVGRYLYAKLHTSLDGHKTSLGELAERARIPTEQKGWAAALAPSLVERMTAFDRLVLAPPSSFRASIMLPIKLAWATRIEYLRLTWFARRQLRLRARQSRVIAAERKRLQVAMKRFIGQHMRRVRRVAELTSYERLFSLWHVFHLPFFYMLVITALLHILAVHMY